jgi:serine protease Do
MTRTVTERSGGGGRSWRIGAVAVLLVLALYGGYLAGWFSAAGLRGNRGAAPGAGGAGGEQAFEARVTDVVRRVSPSVFSVVSTSLMPHAGASIPRDSVGSAFIIERRGLSSYFVTNFHVIENARNIALVSPTGDRYEGTLVGSDPLKDVAVIRVDARIEGSPLPFASSVPQPGSFVLAFGSPYSFANSVSMGIVSAVGRRLPTRFGYVIEGVIQTDAAVNQGNSGGPLVNLAGEVVGVNSAIFSLSGGYEGLGFAIPIEEARKTAERIIEEGEAAERFFGITCADFDKAVAESFDLPVDGVLVLCLAPQSPLARAGVRATSGTFGHKGFVLGDIITHVAGQRVRTMKDLSRVLYDNRGKTVPVVVYREGSFYEVRVKVE